MPGAQPPGWRSGGHWRPPPARALRPVGAVDEVPPTLARRRVGRRRAVRAEEVEAVTGASANAEHVFHPVTAALRRHERVGLFRRRSRGQRSSPRKDQAVACRHELGAGCYCAPAVQGRCRARCGPSSPGQHQGATVPPAEGGVPSASSVRVRPARARRGIGQVAPIDSGAAGRSVAGTNRTSPPGTLDDRPAIEPRSRFGSGRLPPSRRARSGTRPTHQAPTATGSAPSGRLAPTTAGTATWTSSGAPILPPGSGKRRALPSFTST